MPSRWPGSSFDRSFKLDQARAAQVRKLAEERRSSGTGLASSQQVAPHATWQAARATQLTPPYEAHNRTRLACSPRPSPVRAPKQTLACRRVGRRWSSMPAEGVSRACRRRRRHSICIGGRELEASASRLPAIRGGCIGGAQEVRRPLLMSGRHSLRLAGEPEAGRADATSEPAHQMRADRRCVAACLHAL